VKLIFVHNIERCTCYHSHWMKRKETKEHYFSFETHQ